MSLAGLNVLVTRPQGQGASLVKMIEAQGGNAWHYPVLAILGLDAERDAEIVQQCKQVIMDLDGFHHVIFISTNAVTFGVEWIDQYWAQLPVGLSWYGIGQATNAALQAAGIPICTADVDSNNSAMNSEALLQHPLLQTLDNEKVLIVRGVGGRNYLEEQLLKRNASVQYAECYRREPIENPTDELARMIKEHRVTTVCVNSGDSILSLCELAGEAFAKNLRALTLAVPGQRVAEMARNKGFEKLIVAENASDRAMVAALLSTTVGVN